jgi:hypothetical protein
LKIKLKGCYFEIIEVIEAESQAVLNTLNEHGFQDAFQNASGAGKAEYAEGDYSEGDGGQ